MDFFLKRSLSCLLLSFNSQLIKGPEWDRQISLSCLLWQYQIKNSVAQRDIWSVHLNVNAKHSTPASTPKQQECVSETQHTSQTWMWLQIPFYSFQKEKKKKGADVLCFVFPRFSQKWRSFTVSSIDWPRADLRFLRIVKTMSVHNSHQACYRAFNQLPAIACWVTQGFILWQTGHHDDARSALFDYSGFMLISSFTHLKDQTTCPATVSQHLPDCKAIYQGESNKASLTFHRNGSGRYSLKMLSLKKIFFWTKKYMLC